MSARSDKVDNSDSLSAEIESIGSISSIMEQLDKVLDEVTDSVEKVSINVPSFEDVKAVTVEDKEDTRKMEVPEIKSPPPLQCVDVEEKSELLHDEPHKSQTLSFSDDGEDVQESNEEDEYDAGLYEDDDYVDVRVDDEYIDDYMNDDESGQVPRTLPASIQANSEDEEEVGESKSEEAGDDDECEDEDAVDEHYGMLAGNAGGDNDDNTTSLEANWSSNKGATPVNKRGPGAAANESFEETTPSRKPRNVSGHTTTSRFAKPAFRGGRRPPPVQRGERPVSRPIGPPLERRNTRNPLAVVPRGGGRGGGSGMALAKNNNPRGEAEDGSSLFISNWGFRSNLIDQNGNFQRATTDLKNYIVSYKSKYLYFFDLVNGRYPQYVRTLPNKMEIWRMSFNVYASGFSEYISHLGEIHCFYQMEMVDGELRWVYKDFNFYPNRMRYGFRVNTFDIADVHSRFVKFVCVRDNIIKQFPYVEIHHKVFIGKKFDHNVRNMLNRLKVVKRELQSDF